MQYSKALQRPGCTATIAMVIILVALYLLFGKNLYMGGAPQPVIDIAMDQLVETCVKKYGNNCNDFRVVRAQEKTISEANRAAGVDGAWCVELSFDTLQSQGWSNQHLFIDVARTNDKLEVLKSDSLASKMSVKTWDASREQLWSSCLRQ